MAECYYFDDNGWAVTSGLTLDGFWKVNAEGAWVENQVVKTKKAHHRRGGGGRRRCQEAEHPEKQDPAEAVLHPAEVLMAAVTDMRMMTMMNGMIMQMDPVSGSANDFKDSEFRHDDFQPVEGNKKPLSRNSNRNILPMA